jgi:glycosyltransferase involved in cell wall biosynthesis
MGASYARSTAAPIVTRWVAVYERYALARVRHAFVSLNRDVEAFGFPHVTLLPHGFDPVPRMEAGPQRGKRLRFGFVGLLGHEPNRVGLLWFVEHVWPQLRGAVKGELELHAAGTALPPPDEQYLRHVPGVVLHGYIPDLGDFYRSIDLAIAPLIRGEGAPTKVIEALGHGVPVAGTPVGLRGVPPELRSCCLQISGTDWTPALGWLAQGREAVASNGNLRDFTWAAVFAKYAEPILTSST